MTTLLQQHWFPIKDGDPRASALFKRHYSCYRYTDRRRSNPYYRNRHLIVGPGEKLLLLTTDGTALFVWRRFKHNQQQHAQGVNCAIFRNESAILSSKLILEAEKLAWRRWPGQRLYTFVNPRAIRSTNPGFCFQAAGWRRAGRTKKRKLIILEKHPAAQEPLP